MSLARILNLSLFDFRRRLREARVTDESKNGQADKKADKKIKSTNRIPQNLKVLALAREINRQAKKPDCPTKKDITIEFTDGDERSANNLLRQLRRFPLLLERGESGQ